MGLVPWVHAVLAGGFLQGARSALRQAQEGRVLSKKEHCGMRQLTTVDGGRAI
jgi:hypothetical protein